MNDKPAPDRPALKARLQAGWRRLRGGALSPGRAAASIAVGLFVGCTPLYGVHVLIVLAICVPLRLDTAIAYFAAHVSNPVTAPFLFLLELQIGSLILTGHGTALSWAAVKTAGLLSVSGRLVCGAVIVAPTAALIGATVTWFLTLRVQDAREPARAEARKRTLSRYRRAPLSVRTYVGSKLRADPALDSITALPGSFGRVLDAGCGFGHIGLSLLDRGRAVALVGIDADRRRIEIATLAADGSARFDEGDLARTELSSVDTVLFVDSLHYLPLPVQDAVLTRASAALAPGGRLIVREIATGTSLRNRLTEWLERRAARRRGHEGALIFREPSDFARVMETQGLRCSGPEPESSNLLEHALIVGEKAVE